MILTLVIAGRREYRKEKVVKFFFRLILDFVIEDKAYTLILGV